VIRYCCKVKILYMDNVEILQKAYSFIQVISRLATSR